MKSTIGRPRSQEIKLSEAERTELQSLARSRALPAALVRRAWVVLMSAEGDSNGAIAQTLEISAPTVGTWRKRSRRPEPPPPGNK